MSSDIDNVHCESSDEGPMVVLGDRVQVHCMIANMADSLCSINLYVICCMCEIEFELAKGLITISLDMTNSS